jgi:hypothetical protein
MRPGDRIGKCFFSSNPCDRIVGKRSDLVFIAAPSGEGHHFETEKAKQVIRAAGLTPVVAVHRDLLSQNIFCEKICTSIIECRFCVVFQNEGNPNVFYEYGMMRPLRKRIISLQRHVERAPFNVQHLDTRRYQQERLGDMLAEAVDDAIAVTASLPHVSKQTLKRPASPFTTQITKLLELEGMADYTGEDLNHCILDTAFRVKQTSGQLHLVAVMEAEWNMDNVLADTVLVCRRLGRLYTTLKQAVKVKESKGWKNTNEFRRPLDLIEHANLCYATPHEFCPSDGDTIVKKIGELNESYPLPTVQVWGSDEVKRRLLEAIGRSKG